MTKRNHTATQFTLTERQAEVLQFMVRENDNGGSATARDIAAHFGWSSPNAAYGHIRALSRKGLVELPGDGKRARLTKRAIKLYSKRQFA